MNTGRVGKRIFKLLAKQSPGASVRAAALRLAGYRIGSPVYIGEDLLIIDEPGRIGLVVIGDRAAVAPRVTLVVSSRPNFALAFGQPVSYGPIVIEEDAWVGTGAIVLPNVTIGRGSVVGAGSVVTRDVPPFTVVAGQPARVLRALEAKGASIGDE